MAGIGNFKLAKHNLCIQKDKETKVRLVIALSFKLVIVIKFLQPNDIDKYRKLWVILSSFNPYSRIRDLSPNIICNKMD